MAWLRLSVHNWFICSILNFPSKKRSCLWSSYPDYGGQASSGGNQFSSLWIDYSPLSDPLRTGIYHFLSLIICFRFFTLPGLLSGPALGDGWYSSLPWLEVPFFRQNVCLVTTCSHRTYPVVLLHLFLHRHLCYFGDLEASLGSVAQWAIKAVFGKRMHSYLVFCFFLLNTGVFVDFFVWGIHATQSSQVVMMFHVPVAVDILDGVGSHWAVFLHL